MKHLCVQRIRKKGKTLKRKFKKNKKEEKENKSLLFLEVEKATASLGPLPPGKFQTKLLEKRTHQYFQLDSIAFI